MTSALIVFMPKFMENCKNTPENAGKLLIFGKFQELENNSGLQDTAPDKQSELGLHCLLRPICTNT